MRFGEACASSTRTGSIDIIGHGLVLKVLSSPLPEGVTVPQSILWISQIGNEKASGPERIFVLLELVISSP
jgi:hypothetical protein